MLPPSLLLDERVGRERVPERRVAAEHELLAERAAEALEVGLAAQPGRGRLALERGVELLEVDRHLQRPQTRTCCAPASVSALLTVERMPPSTEPTKTTATCFPFSRLRASAG